MFRALPSVNQENKIKHENKKRSWQKESCLRRWETVRSCAPEEATGISWAGWCWWRDTAPLTHWWCSCSWWMAGPRGDGDGGWWRRSHCQGTLCLTAAAGWEVAGSREWRPRSILRPLALAPGTASAQLLPVWHPGPTPATLSPGTGQEWSPETINTPPRLEWLVYCLRCGWHEVWLSSPRAMVPGPSLCMSGGPAARLHTTPAFRAFLWGIQIYGWGTWNFNCWYFWSIAYQNIHRSV